MELARETPAANVIRAWEPGRLRIGEAWVHGHVIVAADRVISTFEVPSVDEIDVLALEPAIALDPEVILLGTGPETALPKVDLMADLAERHIGLESMSTPAACRTFNLLLDEGRRVVAVLLNPEPITP